MVCSLLVWRGAVVLGMAVLFAAAHWEEERNGEACWPVMEQDSCCSGRPPLEYGEMWRCSEVDVAET